MRKGQLTSRRIDREYPHQVQVVIPPGGLGDRLTEMHAFCRATDHQTKPSGLHAMRWCFASEEDADAFFGRFRWIGSDQ